jgi:VanZ family protein
MRPALWSVANCSMGSLFHWDQKNFFLLPGGIASIVAIADEIHQAYVPGRDASITDVLLDLVGIILVLFFFFRLLKTKTSSCSL